MDNEQDDLLQTARSKSRLSRLRLSQYSRFRKAAAQEKKPDTISIDEYEPFDDEEPVETEDEYFGENEEPDEPPSPLSRKSKPWRFLPAMTFLTAAWVLSAIEWNGYTTNLFSLSGNALFNNHEYWRLVTSVFMHGSPHHFLANLLLLAVFGWFLFDFFGFMLFPLISLLCGIGANFTAVYFYPPEVSLVGASGMVYAMAALWLVLFVRFHTGQYFGVKVLRAAGTAMVLLFPTTFSPEISYSAHAAGFLYGLVSAIIVMPFTSVKD